MGLEKLFEPGEIAGMKLKNRLVMAPMFTTLSSINGEVTQRMIEYYRARAKGGVGLIIVEVVLADTTVAERIGIRCLNIQNPSHIAQLHELVEAIHDYGAKVAIQLSAGGAKELTQSQMEYLIEAQGQAAARIKRSEADAIEIHAHGSYLMAQTMSPLTNHRTDKYGGDLGSRLRFTLESIQAIKSNVGIDFPLLFRYAGDECAEGGRGLEESKVVANVIEEAGVHALDISAGISTVREAGTWFIPPSYLPKGTWIHLSEGIKQTVSIPVIVAGRLGDPYLAAKVLDEGKADFISMGRPLICDPDLPKKVAAGHPEEVRRCISCNEGCLVPPPWDGRYIRCALNPLAGRELNYREPGRTEIKKKVLVIGAGPGGMEAALIAGQRGHDVVLYEKNSQLGGGQLRLTTIPPHKEELKNIIAFYEVQLKKLNNVILKLGMEATADIIKKERADVVIVATGSQPLIPEISGVDGSNVVTAQEVLGAEVKVGSTVVIIGFGMVGCETANYLSEQGTKVTLLDLKDEVEVAGDVEESSRFHLLKSLVDKEVSILGSRTIMEINNEGVITIDVQGNTEVHKADTVVLATGSQPLAELIPQIAEFANEYYVIGDAKEPRRIMDAIWEGFRCCYEL